MSKKMKRLERLTHLIEMSFDWGCTDGAWDEYARAVYAVISEKPIWAGEEEKFIEHMTEIGKFDPYMQPVKSTSTAISYTDLSIIIDTITEYMYCNYGDCTIDKNTTWNDLENIREQLKQKAIDMIKSNLHTMKGASK